MRVACVLITHLRAKVELLRQPGLRDRFAIIVERSTGRPVVVDALPAVPHVHAGMTLEEALSRHADMAVLEADEPSYRQVFRQALTALQGVSDRVKGAELGRPTRAWTASKPSTAARTGLSPPCWRPSPIPYGAGWRGRRQVPRLRRSPNEQGAERGMGPIGRCRLPCAPTASTSCPSPRT